MAKTRVLLIEDNRLLREGIADMLEEHGDFTVIARAEDGDAARKLKAAGTAPDVVMLDVGLEKANSLKLMKWLREIPLPGGQAAVEQGTCECRGPYPGGFEI